MSHLDEGTLHALLDGELASTELMEIEAHLDGCNACSARLRAAREFLDEADRLVGSVQFGRFAGDVAAAASPQVPRSEKAQVSPPPPPPREHHRFEEASPVLLIPDNPEPSPLLHRWPRLVGWAAMLTFVVSAGFLVNNVMRDTGTLAPAGTQQAAGTAAPAAAERDELAPAAQPVRRDSQPTVLANAKTAPPAPPPTGSKPATDKRAAPTKPAPVAPDLARDGAAAPNGGRELASKVTANLKPRAEDTVSSEDSSDAAEEAATRAAEQEAIRVQAARALSQLDRERRVNRAAAATAALDRTEAARPQVAAAPSPPTIEQRTQVYLRIGLDEASRQLGGPVHVIEGMSPLFMGLAPGRAAAGADTTRPVVRVVYQDPQGRLIVLDQQRNRPGQPTTPGGNGGWSLGDLRLALSGEAPTEVLRTLRSRVR